MRRSNILQMAMALAAVVTVATSLTGCGSDKFSCSCAICINDVPEFPSNSAESCGEFAVQQSCGAYEYGSSATDTCGADPQPVCSVSDCDGQCTCPTN